MDEEVVKALTRLAVGYEYYENTTTTAPNGETAVKKTLKHIPPDINAIRLLEQIQNGGGSSNPYIFYTNEELKAEIKKLYDTMCKMTDGGEQ